MDAGTVAAVRAALALAATHQRNGCVLGAQVQRDILAEVWVITSRDEAKRQRDAALCRAFDLIGRATPVRVLHGLLKRFYSETWPIWSLSAQAPDDTKPFNRALFDACKATSAGALAIPGERQLRRILFGHSSI
jgi:hypothetical protein